MSATTTSTLPLRLPTSAELLMGWHGLFAGSYTVAFVTADVVDGMHLFAGYMTMALLALRLAVAAMASPKGFWGLPRAPQALWKGFLRKLGSDPAGAFAGRTPFVPLSGLAVLAGAALAILSGLLADVFGADDLHEALADLSLWAVALHLSLIALWHFLRSRLARRGA